MKVEFYLVIGREKRYSKPTVRACKAKPATASHEIDIKVNLDLPDALFTKPQLNANIVIPESAVSKREISAEISDNIKESIESITGMQVELKIVGEGE